MFIEEGMNIAKEYYEHPARPPNLAKPHRQATEGGMEIEEVAEHSPEKSSASMLIPVTGFRGFQARRLGIGLWSCGRCAQEFCGFYSKLYRAYEKWTARCWK